MDIRGDLDNETKAQLVLNYIGTHIEEIKHQIKKNTTFESKEFLEEIFAEATLKLAESILKNGTEVKDIKNFVYISFRNLYIIRQNQLRRNRKKQEQYELQKDLRLNETFDQEAYFADEISLLEDAERILSENYPCEDVQMFMEYYKRKSQGKCSYATIADLFGINARKCGIKIKEIKNFLESEGFKERYDEIKHNDYEDLY